MAAVPDARTVAVGGILAFLSPPAASVAEVIEADARLEGREAAGMAAGWGVAGLTGHRARRRVCQIGGQGDGMAEARAVVS